jgi:hypothetical protein
MGHPIAARWARIWCLSARGALSATSAKPSCLSLTS